MADDVIRLNLVLNESTVQTVENRVRNVVSRLNNQVISLNINSTNLDNIISKLNVIYRTMGTINNTSVNINANLTQAQQQYRLETERLRVSKQLEISRQRTLQTENQALTALAQQNRTLNINNNVTHQIEQGVQGVGNNMQTVGENTNDFVSYLSNGVRYLIVYRSLFSIMNQISESFSEMKDVDTALVDVRKTTGMSEEEIEKIRKVSYGVATEYGRVASEYLESVSEFARGGYEELSTELGKVSLLTQNVGDVSADSANKMLLAVDAAYQLEGNVEKLTNVVNGLNNIANLNPTSMEKMADGLQVSASMAQVAGLEIADLVALIGTGTSVTQREGAEVSRAIRTVLMNIRQVKGELDDGTIIDSETIAKAEKALNGVGIATKEVINGTRELRDPMDILDELSEKWGNLNTEAQSVLLEGIANKRQANVLSGILSNWDMVKKMQTEYFDSANSAIKENELYLDSWEAKSAQVSAKWTEYTSNIADTSLIKHSLDTLYDAIVILDTPIGRLTTQIVLVNTALAVSNRLWGAIRARSIVADILAMGVAERSLGTAIQLVTGHLGRQALAWASSPIGMATITAVAIAGVVKAVDVLGVTVEEQREELESLKQEYNEITSELRTLNSELSTTEERMKELESIESPTFAEKEEYDNLVKTNNELQRKIDLLELEERVKSQDSRKAFVSTMQKDTDGIKDKSDKYFYYVDPSDPNQQKSLGKGSTATYSIGGFSIQAVPEDELIDVYENYANKLKELDEQYANDLENKTYKETKATIEQEMEDLAKFLAEKSNQWSSDANGIKYISNPTSEDDKAVNEWLDYIADFQDRMAIAMGGDNAKTNTFNRIVDNWKFDDTVQGLQDLGTQGQVTADMLADPKYDEFINKLVFLGVIDSADNLEDVALAFNSVATSAENAASSAEDYGNEIAVSSILSSVEALSDGLDQLAEIYKDVKNGKTFDYSSILNNDDFKNAFGKYTEEYEKFISTIANSPDDINACQDAFNKLVTAYIYGQGALNNVTEETEKSIITMLEQMGITNAQEIVNRQLAIRTATLADAEENLNEIKNQGIDATIDLENAEAKELLALIDEAKQADLNVDALYGYTMQKIKAQAVTLDTSNDVQGLANLCGSLNIATEAIAAYTTAKEALQKLEAGYDGRTNPSDFVRSKKALEERINQAQLDMQQAVSEFTSGDYRVDVDVEGKYDGTKVSSTKDGRDTKDTFDWIETKLSRIQRTITNLGKTVSATWKNWGTRNNALAQEMSAINQEIATQQQAMDAYMAKANSVGLPEPYKTLVEDGGLRIDEITDEVLKEQIQDYQEWYNKAIDCSDAIQDLQDSLAELAKTKFDNISKQYDDSIAMIEHHTSMLEGYINRAETAGFWASEVYYQKMAEKELENINQLQSKYNDLTNTLNESVSNGLIEQYSEAWYEMRIDINDVEQALQQANTQLIEFNQTLQQIRWDIFDRASDYKDLFIEESNFLAELISRRDLYNEVGSLTADGLAVQGLHAVNYNAYMEQSEAYAKEILKLNEEIANDPNDLELIDRRNELIGLQQEAIKNAAQEKDAIKDLVSNGYDVMLESLNKLIERNKTALQSQKSLFDYEKQVSNQVDEIARLQKIIDAYSGQEGSEEAKTLVQKYTVDLKNAQDALAESEYERYIQDIEKLYDDLISDTETWINQRLDDINGLVSEAIQATNDNAATISGTITDVAESFDTTLSEYTKLLWEGINENTSLLLKPYEDVANGIESGTTKLETILGSIDTKLQTMVDDLNAQATVESESIGQPDIEYNETNNYDDDYEHSEPPQPTSSGITFNGGTFYEDSYKGGKTGNSKNQWTGHEVEVTHESGTGMVHIVDKTTGTILGWVDKDQLQGYATGTTNAKKGFSLVSEKGDELIKDNDGNIILARGEQIFPFEGGETVFNAAKTAELLNGNLMPLSAERLWGNIIKTPRLPEMVNKGVGGSVTNYNQFSFDLPNVVDADSFITELQHSKRFEKIIDSMTAERMMGGNSLAKYKY